MLAPVPPPGSSIALGFPDPEGIGAHHIRQDAGGLADLNLLDDLLLALHDLLIDILGFLVDGRLALGAQKFIPLVLEDFLAPVGLNPAVKPLVPGIIEACRKHGAVYAALVGSSTQPDPAVIPRDLDVLVRFAPDEERRAWQYFDLREELQALSDRRVDLIEVDVLNNPLLQREFERTKVVLLEVA